MGRIPQKRHSTPAPSVTHLAVHVGEGGHVLVTGVLEHHLDVGVGPPTETGPKLRHR